MKTIKNYQQIFNVFIRYSLENEGRVLFSFIFTIGISSVVFAEDKTTKYADIIYYKKLAYETYQSSCALDSTKSFFKPAGRRQCLDGLSMIIDDYKYNGHSISITAHVVTAWQVYYDLRRSNLDSPIAREQRINKGYKIYKCVSNGKSWRSKSTKGVKLYVVQEIVADKEIFELNFEKNSEYVYVLYWNKFDIGEIYDPEDIFKEYSKRFKQNVFNIPVEAF